MRRGLELAGRYRLDERLGRGAMGEVWRGFDLRLERPVAIKMLLGDWSCEPEMSQALARFRREGRAAAKLDHPAIAAVFDSGEHDGHPFLVLELLDGEDLRTVVARTPAGLPIEQALSVGEQVAEGLSAAHAAGVVHRDIKPANVMLLSSGRVKICDFGIARLEGATVGLSVTGMRIGTVAYMSPEQLEDGRVDGRADLYALGCTLFQLLTGRVPYPAEGLGAIVAMHLTAPPPSAQEVRADIPDELDRYLRMLLAKDPADRPADAAEVARRLRAIRGACERTPVRVWQLLGEAESVARSIPDPEKRAGALLTLARVVAERDPDMATELLTDAVSIAPGVTGRPSWGWDIAEIAAGLAAHDPAQAERIARTIRGPYAARAIGNVAAALAAQDPARAERVARTIDDAVVREWTLAKVAGALAARDAAGAERLARTIEGPAGVARALANIAEVVSRQDPMRADALIADAERIARTVDSPTAKSGLLRDIAAFVALRDPDGAERIVAATVGPRRAGSLARIAEVVAERDPARADALIAEAERIVGAGDDTGGRGFDLSVIARAMALRDPVRAERFARATVVPMIGWMVLLDIAETVASSDPVRAERVAHGITEPWGRFLTLAHVAEATAARDPARAQDLLAGAERVARTLTSPADRSRAFAELAMRWAVLPATP